MKNASEIFPREFSEKVYRLSFVCACLVVLLHVNATLVASPAKWNCALHDFFCVQMCYFAVPFFFVVSGFFFARGQYVNSIISFHLFYKKKIISLAIPYVIFVMLCFIFITPVIIGNNWVTGRALLSRTLFSGGGGVAALFGLNGSPCCNGALWYVRTLLILFVFAPVWRILYRKASWLLPIIACMLMAANSWWKWEWQWGLHQDKCAYFFWGIYLARFDVERFKASVMVRNLVVGVWLCISFVLSATVLLGIEWFKYMWLQQVQFAIAIPALWFMYDMFEDDFDRIKLSTARTSFFIYCTHQIVFPVFFSPVRFLLGKSDLATIIETPVTWIGPIWVCVIIAKYLSKTKPRFYKVLSGGR